MEQGSASVRRVGLAAAAAVCALAGAARAQLVEPAVLVVYDSRVPDSLAVAEFYAGSAKVPGGAGGLAPVRANVRVLDLASTGAGVTTPGDITYADFAAKLRTPIRGWLTANNLARDIRCLTLTKGLPHRIRDINADIVGDLPANFVDQFNGSNVTCASVDSELTLLWQDLNAGEGNAGADSKADGFIVNPYWKSALPINLWTTAYITSPKTYTQAFATGPLWQGLTTTGAASSRLLPGDMYLVARLDGKTVADARAIITRARTLVVNPNQVALLFDEAPSDLDNISDGITAIYAGNDYTNAATLLSGDGRFPQAGTIVGDATIGVNWDLLGGPTNFFIGPRLAFAAGQGRLITAPIALLASYGSNHDGGTPTLAAGGGSGTVYATSFTTAPGAIFNTIESYNGRDFGGVGISPWVPQQQAADFLAAGGTFAVANVWEPLASAIPDNQFLVQNFVLGNLTWAEAAWSSIPTLSWMQIVVGDPLARFTRTSEDIDGNGRADIDDLHAWTRAPVDITHNNTAGEEDRKLIIKMLRWNERGDMIAARQ